jgi:hypothetical protein
MPSEEEEDEVNREYLRCETSKDGRGVKIAIARYRNVTNRTSRPMPMGRERGRGNVAIAGKSRVSECRAMLA